MEDIPLETVPGLDLLSSFSVSALIASLIFGIVGLWLFRHGRRESHIPNVIIGVGLMVYPYFVDGAKLTWGVGLALCGAAYYYWP
ncbi:MAG: hypothetical protein J7501_17255 [Bdellovibrio sp.]|nr:hypothetical protein [Bdellovibrio sp.]